MDTEKTVRESMAMLERMSEAPETVLEALDPAHRDRVITRLGVLADRAAGVQAEADLMYVAGAVRRLVEETPALAAWLMPGETGEAAQAGPRRRKITFGYDQAAYRKSRYAQEQAAQIRNHVVECRARLESALQERRQ